MLVKHSTESKTIIQQSTKCTRMLRVLYDDNFLFDVSNKAFQLILSLLNIYLSLFLIKLQ